MPEADIKISLSDGVKLELAKMAHESNLTEDEVVERAIRYLVQVHRGPAIPRFARRLGPIAILHPGPGAGRFGVDAQGQ